MSDVLTLIEQPDSKLVADLHPSPNIEPRLRGLTPSILILHYTGLECVERSLDVLSRPDCKVSCHYVIDEDGRIIQMVAEEMRAWHAGVSSWHAETDINSSSIGIEIQNPGHNGGYPDFPPEQMRAVTALCQDIIARHGIAAERVLAHSDVAPGRKIDPGEKFDWPGLARAGVGHWVEPMAVDPGDRGFSGRKQGPEILAAQELLARYGYGIEPTGIYSERMKTVLSAFQLHFRPARVDGRLDLSTFATLRRLVETLPETATS
jgi:N-acetylmuramoyl-L-alanine amidase